MIDVETCRIWSEYCEIADPYGVDPDYHECVGRLSFVASLESDGPVFEGDLPEDKFRTLRARLDRADRTATTGEGVRDVLLEEYALAVAALDYVIFSLVNPPIGESRFRGVPLDVMQRGVRLALAKLGKEGTPLHEALERELRRGDEHRRALCREDEEHRALHARIYRETTE